MTRAFRPSCVLCVVLMLAAAGCSTSSSSTPTTPTTPGLSLTGTWAASVTFSNISAKMTWVLTQSGTTVTGPVTVAVASGVVLLNGTLSGTVNGTSLAYTITVPAGGLPLQPTCSGQLQGTMTVSGTTMTGPMNLASSSCTSPITNQTITMTKQ